MAPASAPSRLSDPSAALADTCCSWSAKSAFGSQPACWDIKEKLQKLHAGPGEGEAASAGALLSL